MSRETKRLIFRLDRMAAFRAGWFPSDKALHELLFDFHEVQCSDDRDRLYALRSLSRWPVPVDYEKPTEQIYTDFALKELSLRPEILCCSGAFPSATERYCLPSWVPDWGHHNEWASRPDKRSNPVFKPIVLNKHFKCRARMDQPGTTPSLIESGILKIQGVKIDVIKEVRKQIDPSSLGGFHTAINSWYEMYSGSKMCSQSHIRSDKLGDATNEDFIGSLTVGRIRLLPQEYLSLLSHDTSQGVNSGFIDRALMEAFQTLERKLLYARIEEADKLRFRDTSNVYLPYQDEIIT